MMVTKLRKKFYLYTMKQGEKNNDIINFFDGDQDKNSTINSSEFVKK